MSVMKTKTFPKHWNKRIRPDSTTQVTQQYHETRQAGVKAKLAALIEEHEGSAIFHQVLADELRKIRPEDYASVKALMAYGGPFDKAWRKAADESSKVGI